MSDDFSQRAARGQAYNLAIQTAIADGKHHDKNYVLKQYIRHLAMASILQQTPIETIKEMLNKEGEQHD